MNYYDEVAQLQGKIMKNVQVLDDQIRFETIDGEEYIMEHHQDCCEHVYIESIVGDVQDLIGEPILIAEESYPDLPAAVDYEPESHTWTFYKLDTRKGGVTIRWYGSSNGYYGERAGVYKV